MISPADVTACLVTRGDQPDAISRITETLVFDRVIVWDNSKAVRDWKCAGRYLAAIEAETSIVYFQDDDVIVPATTQQSLVNAYQPGVMVANWGHGSDPDGYDDLPLVGTGAIVDRRLPLHALDLYLQEWPNDDAFCYEADFIAGALYPTFKHVYLPFEIDYAIAQHPSRLCNKPWQRELKRRITNRAREIRDRSLVTA